MLVLIYFITTHSSGYYPIGAVDVLFGYGNDFILWFIPEKILCWYVLEPVFKDHCYEIIVHVFLPVTADHTKTVDVRA